LRRPALGAAPGAPYVGRQTQDLPPGRCALCLGGGLIGCSIAVDACPLCLPPGSTETLYSKAHRASTESSSCLCIIPLCENLCSLCVALCKIFGTLMVPARAARVRAAPAAPAAASYRVADSSVAFAKGCEAAQSTAGMGAAAVGAGDLVICLAHRAAFFEFLFTIRARIFVYGHVESSYARWSGSSDVWLTPRAIKVTLDILPCLPAHVKAESPAEQPCNISCLSLSIGVYWPSGIRTPIERS
jgi:hypothetical protein